MIRLRSPKDALALVALCGVYFVAGKLGLKLAFVHASATAVWPSTGIALFAFLIFGYRVWPVIFTGAFLVNLTTAGTVATSISYRRWKHSRRCSRLLLGNALCRGPARL